MYSARSGSLPRAVSLLILVFAVAAMALTSAAQSQNVPSTQQQGVIDTASGECRTWAALRGKCAKDDPNTDYVLDHPNLYVGRTVTLEGRIDEIFSPTTFAMQDNYDLIPDDKILIISVMPVGAQTNVSHTTASGTDLKKPVPAGETVEVLQKEFAEGTIIRATGTVQMFNRTTLEQTYGTIDWGSASLDKYENEPVLLLGAREYAQFIQQQPETQIVVITPEPAPQPAPEPAPEPEVVQPAPQPEPEPAPPEQTVQVQPAPPPQAPPAAPPQPEPAPETLPKTASPLPLMGLAGLLSLTVAFWIRRIV